MFQRKTIAGSLIGGIESTQEVIDFCVKNNVYPDCSFVESKDIDECWKKLSDAKNDDGGRYVLDIKKSLADPEQCPK